MTSLTQGMDPGMVALLLFWTIVVVALVLSATTGELRRDEEPRFTRKRSSRRRATVLPFRRRNREAPIHAERSTSSEISGGIPSRIG